MTNEDKLREAMNLFQEWSNTYSHELVTINSNKDTLEVTLFHECTEGVALLVINAANQKVLGQKAAYVNKLRSNKKWAISIIWMKED